MLVRFRGMVGVREDTARSSCSLGLRDDAAAIVPSAVTTRPLFHRALGGPGYFASAVLAATGELLSTGRVKEKTEPLPSWLTRLIVPP
jgi:hypothetical protein